MATMIAPAPSTTAPDPATSTVSGLVAIRYQGGGSNKVWAGLVLHRADGQAAFIRAWGGVSASKQSKPTAGSPIPWTSAAAATADLRDVHNTKRREGYQPQANPDQFGMIPKLAEAIGWTADTLRQVIAASTLGTAPAVGYTPAPAVGPVAAPMPVAAPVPVPVAPADHPFVSHPTALPAHLHAAWLDSPNHGLTEKVNGERCPVVSDGTTLVAYNRRGLAQPDIPAPAAALLRLGKQFVIDGECYAVGDDVHYAMFDLLEWDGQDIRYWPYQSRIAVLESVLVAAGVIGAGGPSVARAVATIPGLVLLTPATDAATKHAVAAEILKAEGEGCILRTLMAAARIGDTPDERKIKYETDMDVVALGIKPGKGSGSVRYGVFRASDGALIELGTVRSGLTDDDVEAIAAALAAPSALRPVLKLRFLPIRTVKISPVHPVATRRDDKLAALCTSDQLIELLGEDRAPLIAAARPFRG